MLKMMDFSYTANVAGRKMKMEICREIIVTIGANFWAIGDIGGIIMRRGGSLAEIGVILNAAQKISGRRGRMAARCLKFLDLGTGTGEFGGARNCKRPGTAGY